MIEKDEYHFSFYCKGLSAYPTMQLLFNISTSRFSQLCSFLPTASLAYNEIGGDIYSPILWKTSLSFIQKRISAFFENCLECPVVGICRGGCVFTGLDKDNKKNNAACAYHLEMWDLIIKKFFNETDED